LHHSTVEPYAIALRRIRQRRLGALLGAVVCVLVLMATGEMLSRVRWAGWVSSAVFVACGLLAWRCMVECGNLFLNSRCPRCGDYYFLQPEVRPRALLELTRTGPCGSCGLPIRGDGEKGR